MFIQTAVFNCASNTFRFTLFETNWLKPCLCEGNDSSSRGRLVVIKEVLC